MVPEGAPDAADDLKGVISGVSFQGTFADVITDVPNLPPVRLRTVEVLGNLSLGRQVRLRLHWQYAVMFRD